MRIEINRSENVINSIYCDSKPVFLNNVSSETISFLSNVQCDILIVLNPSAEVIFMPEREHPYYEPLQDFEGINELIENTP